MPLLTIAWLLPLVGALALLCIGNADSRRDGVIRWLSLAVSLATFAVTLVIWASFDASSPEYQLVEQWNFDSQMAIPASAIATFTSA